MATGAMMDLNKGYGSFAYNTILLSASQVAVSLLLFLRLPILTKGLGAAEFGTWGIIWVTVLWLTCVTTLGLNMAMVRFISGSRELELQRDGYMSTLVIVLASATVISLAFYFLAANLQFPEFPIFKYQSTLIMMAIMIVTQTLSLTSLSFLQAVNRIGLYSLFTVIKSTIEIVAMYVLINIGLGLPGALGAVICGDIVFTLVVFFIAMHKFGWSAPRFRATKEYFIYGLPLIPTNIIAYIIIGGDRYILGYLLSPQEVGVYVAAYTLSSLTTFFIRPIQAILLQSVAADYDNRNHEVTRTYFRYTYKYYLLFSVPLVCSLTVLSPLLLRILTTPEFLAGSWVVPLVAAGIVFYGLNQLFINVFFLTKSTYWIMILLSATAVIYVGLNMVLVSFLNIVGAGIANVVSFAVLGLATIFISRRYFTFDLQYSFVMKCIAASLLMTGALYIMNPSDLLQLLIVMPVGIVLYLLLVFLFRCVSLNEINLVGSALVKNTLKH